MKITLLIVAVLVIATFGMRKSGKRLQTRTRNYVYDKSMADTWCSYDAQCQSQGDQYWCLSMGYNGQCTECAVGYDGYSYSQSCSSYQDSKSGPYGSTASSNVSSSWDYGTDSGYSTTGAGYNTTDYGYDNSSWYDYDYDNWTDSYDYDYDNSSWYDYDNWTDSYDYYDYYDYDNWTDDYYGDYYDYYGYNDSWYDDSWDNSSYYDYDYEGYDYDDDEWSYYDDEEYNCQQQYISTSEYFQSNPDYWQELQDYCSNDYADYDESCWVGIDECGYWDCYCEGDYEDTC